MAKDSATVTLKAGHVVAFDGEVLAEIVAVTNGKVSLRLCDGSVIEAREGDRVPLPRKRKPRLTMPAVKTLVAAIVILVADIASGQQIVADHPPLIVASVVQQVREPAENIPQPVVAEIRTHVVQVRCYGAGGATHSGSGIYLGDKLVLTAAHVVEGARRARVNFPNPADDQGPFLDTQIGTIRATDATWDQAVIELDALPKHNPPGSPLARDNPTTGDKVTFAGYPGGKQLRVMRGQFEGYAGAAGQPTADWFHSDAGVISGYSGGAAYDDTGCLYGNLWGSTGHSTVAVCLGRTKRFLFPWNARLEAWRIAVATGNAGKMQMQWGYCPPGQQCPPPQRQPRYIEPGDEGSVPPPGQPGGNQGGTLTPVQPPTQQPTQPPIAIPDANDIGNQIDAIVGRIDGIVGKLDKLKGCECDPNQGCKCEDDSTPAPTIKSKVFVVIGDPKSEYYGRLKTDVEKTATYFDTVLLKPPPPGLNVGTLPAISFFVDGVHVITHRGVIPVQSQLHKIRNGEFQ